MTCLVPSVPAARLADPSPDVAFLEVALPGRFETAIAG